MKCVRFIVLLLLVIGALNWGLVGFFQYDVIAEVFGGMMNMAARVVYAIIGIAGLIGLKFLCKSSCGCGCRGARGCRASCR